MVAAPAQADEATYLEHLAPKYTFLSSQQSLDEGHRVCDAERSGIASPENVKRVYEDLAVSMTAALDIVMAAVVDLGCT